MADDSDSIFAKAGFDVPKAVGRGLPPVYVDAPGTEAKPVATSAVKAPPSIFESAGFTLPGKSTASAAAAPPSWEDAEALENAAALGIQTQPKAPPKPGRGITRALADYPDEVVKGIGDLLAAPGNVLASSTPSTSESLIPTAFGLGSLTLGGEYVRPTGVGRVAGIPSAMGTGLTAIADKVAPTTRSTNALVKAIGPENVPEAVNMLKSNPRLTLADVSDPVRLRTQGLMAGGTPDVQDFISKAVKDRAASRLEATNTAFTRAMGPSPDVTVMVEGLKERARDVGRNAIQPALENAKPVDVSPVIAAINEKLKPGINPLLDPGSKLPLSAEQEALARVKQQLIAPTGETLFDAKRLHEVQSNIGDQAFQYSKSPDPKDRLLGAQLRTVNEKLIDQIDQAAGPVPLAAGHARIGLEGGTKYVDVPEGRAGLEKLNDPDFLKENAQPANVGAYRAGRAKFKDAKDISEAFESGFDTLKNRSGLSGALEDSPQAFRNWMKDATPEEIVARRLGTRADIDQKINSVKNGALAGQNITSIPYNQEKLTALFGDKEADRLIRVMQDAKREADTNAAIHAGSKTAETTKAAKDIEVRKVGGGNPLQYVAPVAAELLGQGAGLPGVGFAASLAAKGVHMGAQKLGQMQDIATNMQMAKSALATGRARQETINALLSHPKVVRQLKKSSNALTAP